MVYLKENAIGIDAEINRYMGYLNDALNVQRNWGIDIYGRIYKERTQDNVLAPYALVSGKDYKELFLNDRTVGECGFYVDDTRKYDNNISVSCDVIFSVNLDIIDSGSLQREDEKVILQALSAITKYNEVTSIKTGLETVFSGFSTDRIRYRDMQPFFNFSFTITLIYKKNNCYGL